MNISEYILVIVETIAVLYMSLTNIHDFAFFDFLVYAGWIVISIQMIVFLFLAIADEPEDNRIVFEYIDLDAE